MTSPKNWDDSSDFVALVDPTDDACRIICISDREKQRLKKPFGRTLIIKYMGKGIGFYISEKKQSNVG